MKVNQPILIADDSENDIFLMRAAFKKAEFSASIRDVRNGDEAIAYLNGDGPFSDRTSFPIPMLMLLDLNMPMKSGFDVMTWVRTQPALKRLSIVIMTASTRAEDIERAFELGANSYLVKPSSMDELVLMIRCLRDWILQRLFTCAPAHPVRKIPRNLHDVSSIHIPLDVGPLESPHVATELKSSAHVHS